MAEIRGNTEEHSDLDDGSLSGLDELHYCPTLCPRASSYFGVIAGSSFPLVDHDVAVLIVGEQVITKPSIMPGSCSDNMSSCDTLNMVPSLKMDKNWAGK